MQSPTAMPKDTNKENVPPKLRQRRKRKIRRAQNGTIPAALAAFVASILPAVPVNTAQPPNAPVVAPGVGCLGRYCQTCNPQIRAFIAVQPQRYILKPPVLNPYVLRPIAPPPYRARPRRQVQAQKHYSDRHRTRHQKPVRRYPSPLFEASIFTTVPEQGSAQTSLLALQGNNHGLERQPQHELITQFDSSAGIWPSTVQTRLESGLHDKVADHPQAKIPLQHIEICQISTCFKIGEQGRDGFRWAALLLPKLTPDSMLYLPSPNQQCAWLLDPCARMEGREFLQFLDPEMLVLRRKLHLRPRIQLTCEPGLDTERLIVRMENDEEWGDVLCRSVMDVASPHSLVLSTGIWVTVLHLVALGAYGLDNGPTLGTVLEHIGNMELGRFLHPARLKSLNQTASQPDGAKDPDAPV